MIALIRLDTTPIFFQSLHMFKDIRRFEIGLRFNENDNIAVVQIQVDLAAIRRSLFTKNMIPGVLGDFVSNGTVD